MAKNIRLRHIIGKAGDVAIQLRSLHFSQFYSAKGWHPDINAYRYDDRIEVCVDLAGVEKADIDLKIHPRRLVLSGERRTPGPCCQGTGCREVLAFEIVNGPFERDLELPADVLPEKVTARQENGMLFIELPLRHPES